MVAQLNFLVENNSNISNSLERKNSSVGRKLSLDSQCDEVSLENTKLMRSSFQEIRVFVNIASCSKMVSLNK